MAPGSDRTDENPLANYSDDRLVSTTLQSGDRPADHTAYMLEMQRRLKDAINAGNTASTTLALRSLKGRTVAVGPFTAAEPGRTSIWCRGGAPVKVPGETPFEAYFRQALLDELTLAELYAPGSPVTLTGHVESLDFTSGIMITGAWTIAMSLRSSNGQMLSVQHIHEFSTAYIGDVACGRVAAAFAPAVQAVITKLVRHPHFPALLAPVNACAALPAAPAAR